MASTPSPAAELPRTPPAPRLGGYYDSWEPYQPRKSARISERNNNNSSSNRTPSPQASRQSSSPRKSRHDSAAASMSPHKRRQPVADSVRRASGPLTAEGTAQAAAILGLKGKSETRASGASGMLTPTKTPRKPNGTEDTKDIDSFKRNLFGGSNDSSIPSSRTKRQKKYSGMTLESFTAESVEDPIKIFTDSQDRVPEKDKSNSNPFYGDAAPQEPTKRRSKQKMVQVPGVGMITVEEAARRDDGMLCTFRGKTFFRPYAQPHDEDHEETEAASSNLMRPLSRSTIQPRRLFQSEKPQASIEDEEAVTDVEDNVHISEAEDCPATPVKAGTGREKTPEAPKFGPVSPPATKRTTRSMNRLLEDSTPIKPSRQSPFETWRVAKKTSKAPRMMKRQGDDLSQEQAKRARA